MSFLGEWLKQIIIIVLFAVFVDLLLPNRAMERYVRFVVSLLILLTLIAPVVRIFAPEAKQKLETAIMDEFIAPGSQDTGQSTQSILKQGEKLRQKQEAEALQYAAEEAARQMKQSIEQETGQAVRRVTVKLISEAQDSRTPSVPAAQTNQLAYSMVEVVMAAAGTEEAGSGEQQPKNGISVQPVDKVNIDVKLKTGQTATSPESMGQQEEQTQAVIANKDAPGAELAIGEPEQPKQAEAGIKRQIEELLSRQWGVPREAVTVLDQ
ncbi:stage III sporulation protein AF [Paenibacillus aceti]|uniref:Stage III sporulation protein AF n=1 Tax=Paenibacillus aceti TaxID=1820010 RepID=A0ABQ1VRU7_9BACL|nr:stage III sporulation protein AF [Paenibacillus aceti]GGF88307.1 hypothetical protein GCM10010913_07170 [Paenibacillus aceti]